MKNTQKLELNSNVVPNELIVGITGDLCYVTYKDSKGKLNSEKSWTQWSRNSSKPLIVQNKFANGFKLAGVNERCSSNAGNSENMLIEHPLFKKSFEISMSRFMKIAKRCTIINGEFNAELIMTNSRDIVFEDEYHKLVQDYIIKNDNKTKILSANKSKQIPSKSQVPGKFYIDTKNNTRYCFLGSAVIDDVLKYVYIHDSDVQDIKSKSHSNKIPCLLVEHRNSTYKTVYKYSFSCLKNKKTVMHTSNTDYNLFDQFTYNDWALIESVYSIVEKTNSGYPYNWANAMKTIKINFREDYINAKN